VIVAAVLVEEIEFIKTNIKKPMAAVAEITDHTAYNALINDHLNNNILSCSQQNKNGHVYHTNEHLC